MAKFTPPVSKAAEPIFEQLRRDARRAGTALKAGDLWGLAALAELIVSHTDEPASAKASSIRGYLEAYGLLPSARTKRQASKPDLPANPFEGLQ